ncbi:MAG: beta-hydroxyacyl-ACP dehydratase [Oscillospiraceae bacterium]|nr:beta-hydroxyacyl-ACP dehydratase [Oscillospiraceae bacterium]
MKLNQEELKAITPLREPMLLVTAVEEMEPGQSAITSFYVNPDWDIFKGHFPDEPMLPGVYTIECMAQAAIMFLLSTERYCGRKPLLLGIDKAKFMSKVLPGTTLKIHAKLTKERLEKAIATCSAEVYDNGKLAASGEIVLAMR